MREQEPSRTALAAATHRAAHQLLEGGRIFSDPLAVRILPADPEDIAREARADPARRGMRVFIAARTEVAEAALAQGVEARGVRQLVVLGAGLDTFAYRNPYGDRLRVFEVDHPATQAWKRRRLGEAGIAVPTSLAYAPVDFERDDLIARLAEAGCDPGQRTVFSWLGVVPYLSRPAIAATLAAIGRLSGGAEVIFDYSDPPASLGWRDRARHAARAARVAALGEPFLSYFEPEALHAELRAFGFDEVRDHGPRALFARAASGALPWMRRRVPERGGHVLHAATPVG